MRDYVIITGLVGRPSVKLPTGGWESSLMYG